MERPKSRWTLESINDDVFHEICKAILETTCPNEQGKLITGHQSIKSLSVTSRIMRKRLESIVFRSISIDGQSWYISLEALKLLRKCQPVRYFTKRLHLNIRNAAPGSLESVDGLPEQFAAIICYATKLEKISIDIPKNEISSYRLAAQQSRIELPSVKTLELGLQMQWMIGICPGVTTIKLRQNWPLSGLCPGQHSYDFVKSAGLAKHLQTFEMDEHWTAELVESVYNAMPNLQNFSLLGARQFFKLKNLLPPLSCFRNLKTLSVPHAAKLGVGFSPPGCGTIYLQPGGDEVRRRVREEERLAEQKASKMIFNTCPRLETLWIGNKNKPRAMQDSSPNFGESMVLNEVHSLFD